MNSNLINNVTHPVSNEDASTKKYVDTGIKSCLALKSSRNMSEALNMNGNFINNVTHPVNNQDVSTKNYVDAATSNCWNIA